MHHPTARVLPAIGALLLTGLALPPPAAAKADLERPTPTVVGLSHAITLSPDLSEASQQGATRLWQDQVFVKEASFLKAHFVDLNLRAGDVLILRSATGHVVEQISGRGPKDWGTFWALSAKGEELQLELSFSAPYATQPFRIDQIIIGEPGVLGDPPGIESICQPEDFEDVWCYKDDPGKWANVMASAGVMTVGGHPSSALWCSASNVSPRGYLLTNEHCITTSGDCTNSEFVFKFYREGCNNGAPTNTDWEGFRCNEIVIQAPFTSCDQGVDGLDFSLCEVIGNPAETYGYVNPDPVRLTDGEGIYILQHPDGRPHEITQGEGQNVDVDNAVLRYYDTLDTEGGSSGSPIFRESDDRMIGLHHCGGCETPGTGNRGMLMADIYPLIVDYLCTDYPDLGGAPAIGLAEVDGNGNPILDPGETWEFTPQVRNTSCDDVIYNVRGELAVAAESERPIGIPNPLVSFGDIAPGEIGTAIAPVQMRIGRGVDCGGMAVFDMVNLQADNGGPFADQLMILSNQIGDETLGILFSDDFSAGLAQWTVIDGGTGSGPAATWTTDNPGGRELSLTEPFAIADSDELGSGYVMDEELISPEIDCAGFEVLRLEFKHDFSYYSGGGDEQCDVDIRSSLTGDWVNIANYRGASASGSVVLDITQYAADQSDVQVRFHHWDASYDWWWAVDDVAIVGSNGFVCGGPFFAEYGDGCAGGGGFLPHLSGSGQATPGSPVTIHIENGLPGSTGELYIAAKPIVHGGCDLIRPPFVGPFTLDLDANGDGSFRVIVPRNAPPGKKVYLQWTGDDPTPPESKSNGMEVFVQ